MGFFSGNRLQTAFSMGLLAYFVISLGRDIEVCKIVETMDPVRTVDGDGKVANEIAERLHEDRLDIIATEAGHLSLQATQPYQHLNQEGQEKIHHKKLDEDSKSAEALDNDRLHIATKPGDLDVQTTQPYHHPAQEVQEEIQKSYLSKHITPASPLIVLNLPNSGEVAINRYFKCSGLSSEELGRFWTPHKPTPIGECMYNNANAEAVIGSPLRGCGDFRVWTQLEDLDKRKGICFFPLLQPDTMQRMVTHHPNATFLQVIRDPDQWAETLSMDEKARWPHWCNRNHREIFPKPDAPKSEWAQFYIQTRDSLRNMLQQHPSVKYIEIDMDANPAKTATMLHSQLGIKQSCWTESALRPDRPNEIHFPIFVAALPKSGTTTTYEYLNCGFGEGTGAHHMIKQTDGKLYFLGLIMHINIQKNRPIFSDCGDFLHYSDAGNPKWGKCFYPSVHGGLEYIYKSYPYGTIINVRRNPQSWYRSVKAWRLGGNLMSQWMKKCDTFPGVNSTEEDFVDFYHWQGDTVRQFAKQHPTMTYIEVDLEADETPTKLEEYFGFDPRCWGHANVNKGLIPK